MNSNRLLLITSEFPPQPGGIGNHAYNLAKAFSENGVEVRVHTNMRSKDGKNEQDFDAIQPFSVTRISRRKIVLLTYFNRIVKAIKLARDCDTIIVSGKFSIWMGGILHFIYKRRIVAVIHGSEVLLPNNWLKKSVDFCLKRFDFVIAVSHYTQSLVSGLGLKNLYVIPNGFKLSADKSIRISGNIKSPVQLITVGNVTLRKGQQNVISALPELTNDFPDVHYNIVGIPTEKGSLVELSKKLGVENNVTFHGKVSDDRKIELLSTSTIFVMLSEKTAQGDVEGFGIAILEANSLGIPAIGSLGCGIEDVIKNGYSGKLIPHNDTRALNEAIKSILEDYEGYSKNAIKWSLQFDWKIIIKEYLMRLYGRYRKN